jgi:hypothetical protein
LTDKHPRDRLGKEPDGSIAKDLGISYSSVFQIRTKLGIPSYQDSRPKPTESEYKHIPAKFLAKKYGCCYDTMLKWRRNSEVKYKDKYTLVYKLRQLHKSNDIYKYYDRELAEMFGTTKHTINITRRRVGSMKKRGFHIKGRTSNDK